MQPRKSPSKMPLSIFFDTYENPRRWLQFVNPLGIRCKWSCYACHTYSISATSKTHEWRILLDFLPILMKTPEDDTDAGYPGHQAHLGLLRMSYLILATSKTSRVKNINRFFSDTYENSQRWHRHGLLWAPWLDQIFLCIVNYTAPKKKKKLFTKDLTIVGICFLGALSPNLGSDQPG